MHWYPVELHTHTCHSDGDFTVKELVRTAKRRTGRLALTDHNTASGVEEFCREAKKQGILPIRGLEWTTYHGHMTVLEEDGYTDWRGASRRTSITPSVPFTKTEVSWELPIPSPWETR